MGKCTVPWLKSEVCKEIEILNTDSFISEQGLKNSNAKYLNPNTTLIALVGATKGKTAFLKIKATTNQNIGGISSNDENIVLNKYIYYNLKRMYNLIICDLGQYDMLNLTQIKNIKIPLPPLDIQQKIVSEIEKFEEQEQRINKEIKQLQEQIETNFKNIKGKQKRLDEVCELKSGNFVKASDINKLFSSELYPCYGGNGLRGYTKTLTNDGTFSLVGRQGALCGNVHLVSGKFHATEHALVAYPKQDIDNIWLYYQLLFMNLNQYATGTAQPGLSVMNLNPIEISVPTIAEQKKIVSAIEKKEVKINELKEQIADLPKQKQNILKKYLE